MHKNAWTLKSTHFEFRTIDIWNKLPIGDFEKNIDNYEK